MPEEIKPEELRKFTPEPPVEEKVTTPAVGHFGQPEGVPQKKYRLSKWYEDYLSSEQRARNLAINPPTHYPTPPRMPNDAYKDMENYDKLTAIERGMAEAFQTGIPKKVAGLKEFLPDPIEKVVFGIGNFVIKGLSYLDFMEEGIERSSGLIRQWKLASENDDLDNFYDNLGDAWAAGSMFYDVSQAPIIAQTEPTILSFPTDMPSSGALVDMRKQITALTDQGIGRKEALEQVKAEYMDSLGALSIRAIKQDIMGHILFSPFIIAQLMGYAPIDIVKKASIAAGNKYIPGQLVHMEDALRVAAKADDLDEVARLTNEIAIINKTMKPITANDKVSMFLTGNFPKPLPGASKLEEVLYFVGNTLAQSDNAFLKGWQRINPLSLTPEARVHEWTNRIDGYLGAHVLSQNDPYKIVDDLTKLGAQATSGKLSAMAATPDGRMIQSFLRSSELTGQTLLADFARTSADGKLIMHIARRLNVKAPDLLDDIIAGKGSTIAKRLAAMGDEGALIGQQLTPDVLKRLGQLKGTPYTPELFKRILHNGILDELARLGIVQFGLKQRGLIQKWTAFMKAGETLAFLRMNPTFAARNWINNEFTMIARGIGGDFFSSGIDDLAVLTKKLNFTPLRASQAFTMAGLEVATLGEIGEAASKRIANAIAGDAIWLDKWAKAINKANLGPLDFGKLAWRAEAAASRKAIVKGYTRAWRTFWTPDSFTSASRFLPQSVIRELGEDAVKQLDNILADAGSLDDINNILANIDKIDLNRSTTGIFSEIEERLGIKLVDQFEELELEKLRSGLDRAMKAKSGQEVHEIFDDLHKNVIKNISDESARVLDVKISKFENAVEAERGMALLGVTEELTNQLDVFEYMYSSGMARFRPDDVSKVVRDAYWPVWLDQQTQFWKVKYDRIDAAIEGIQKGGKNIDLNLDQAIRKLENKKNIWNKFFEKRNKLYGDFFDDGVGNWDEIIEQVDEMYKIAADTDLAVIKDIDDLMEQVVRINNPELGDGFAGWRAAIREWKTKDRAHTRTYAYLQKKGELPVDSMSYNEFWKERGRLQAELGELKNRGYAMMEGNQEELAWFSQIVNEPGDVSERLAKRIAKDLEGKATTLRAGQVSEPELTPMFPNEAREEQWFSRNFWTLRELEEEAIARLGQPASRLDMSDFAKDELGKFLNNAGREMADAQYSSVRMAEYYRDSALLNYNRKLNYDTWLGTFMPYEFWMTHSMAQWAIQTINRPAMLAFYMRLRQLQDRIALEDSTFPTRLRGKMKIKIPPWLGMQEWMGDSLFVDPLNIVSPFGQMTMPYQMVVQRGLSNMGAVERELDRMVRDGEITRKQATEAESTQSGQAWGDALAIMEKNADERTDNYELLSALSSVHAPYDWMYKSLTGQPEEIGPFLPATFTVTRFLGMMGIDWPHEKANAPARIRRFMGLPGFDQWEDYRVERMLTNLSATGEITPEQAARAMIEHSGIAWELARKRAAKEYAGGPWWVAFAKTLAMQAYIYPEGEFKQRQLSDDFEKAMEAYDAGDTKAYNEFFDMNPEFANRLSLWDEPEERMRNFLVDDIWNLYNDLGNLDKKIVRESLGDEFVMRFLDKDTSNYNALSIEQLQMWGKMMGGDPPGTLKEAFPIDFAPPEVSTSAQIFYDTRNENFPDFYELQNKYFDLAENARKDYLRMNPQLKRYWDWRRTFLKQNPTVAPYIDDNFEPKYSSVQEMEQAYEEEPSFVAAEFANYIGAAAVSVIKGGDIPPDIVEWLTTKAEELGITYEELIQKVKSSQ